MLIGDYLINVGLLSYQFNSVNFTASGYSFDTYAYSITKTNFKIKLLLPIAKITWLIYLDVMYISLDINKNPEFVVFDRKSQSISLNAGNFKNNLASQYVVYYQYTYLPQVYEELIFMTAISGHEFRSTPQIYIQITL